MGRPDFSVPGVRGGTQTGVQAFPKKATGRISRTFDGANPLPSGESESFTVTPPAGRAYDFVFIKYFMGFAPSVIDGATSGSYFMGVRTVSGKEVTNVEYPFDAVMNYSELEHKNSPTRQEPSNDSVFDRGLYRAAVATPSEPLEFSLQNSTDVPFDGSNSLTIDWVANELPVTP